MSDEPDAFMKFHVVSGLHRGRKHYCSLTVYLGYSESLPDDKEPNHQWNCKSISCTINKNGYYSALHHTYPSSSIPFEDVKVWHQTNNSYKVINLHSVPSFCQDSRSETHKKSETCDITIENSMHAWINQHQCVVVDMGTKADMLDSYIQLHPSAHRILLSRYRPNPLLHIWVCSYCIPFSYSHSFDIVRVRR